MGAITRALANNITTGGVITSSGINNSSLSSVTDLPTGVGGSMVLLNSGTISSATAVEFNSTYITDTYKFYDLHLSFYTAANFQCYIQTSTDNGSSFVSSGYKHAEQFGDAGGTFTEFKSTSASFLARLGDSGGAGANELHNGYM